MKLHARLLGKFAAAILSLGLAGAAAAAAPNRTLLDRVSVVVNQDTITEGELEEQVLVTLQQQGLKPSPGSKAYQKARAEILDAIIREMLLAQEADKMGITVNDSEVDQQVSTQMDAIRKRFNTTEEFQDALHKEGIDESDLKAENKRRLTRQFKAQRVLAAKREMVQDKSMMPEAEVKARYQKKPADFDAATFAVIFFRIPDNEGEKYRAEARKQAEDLLKKIQGGEDFAAMAKKYSEDPLSADKGGNMGEMFRVQMNEMDPGLGRKVLALSPKQPAVVVTAHGVYIVKVSSKRRAPYGEAASYIRKMVQGSGQVDAMEAWVKELRDKAYIKEVK